MDDSDEIYFLNSWYPVTLQGYEDAGKFGESATSAIGIWKVNTRRVTVTPP